MRYYFLVQYFYLYVNNLIWRINEYATGGDQLKAKCDDAQSQLDGVEDRLKGAIESLEELEIALNDACYQRDSMNETLASSKGMWGTSFEMAKIEEIN